MRHEYSASDISMVSISGNTTAAQIRDFERQMRDVAQSKIPRAVQFALNGVAIDASKRMQTVLPTVLDHPTTTTTTTTRRS